MRAVPRQELRHPVDAGHGEVECLLGGLRWQRLSGDERRGERKRRIRNAKSGSGSRAVRRRWAVSGSPAPASANTTWEVKSA